MISAEPFLAWLQEHEPDVAVYERLGEAWGMEADSAYRRLTRWRVGEATPERAQIEDVLVCSDSTTTFEDLYGEQPSVLPSGRRRPSHAGFPIVIPEDVLIEAHRRHLDEGLSTRAMGREYFDRCAARTPQALSRCFHNAFRMRGWETLSHSEAVALFNRRKVAHLPRCAHVWPRGRKKNQRCPKRTGDPSGFCWHHRPEGIQVRLAELQLREVA